MRDMAGQVVLDLVPLRSTRRIVKDVDHKLRRIGELLQLDFPQPHARSIRAAAVGRDRQLAGMRISLAPRYANDGRTSRMP